MHTEKLLPYITLLACVEFLVMAELCPLNVRHSLGHTYIFREDSGARVICEVDYQIFKMGQIAKTDFEPEFDYQNISNKCIIAACHFGLSEGRISVSPASQPQKFNFPVKKMCTLWRYGSLTLRIKRTAKVAWQKHGVHSTRSHVCPRHIHVLPRNLGRRSRRRGY